MAHWEVQGHSVHVYDLDARHLPPEGAGLIIGDRREASLNLGPGFAALVRTDLCGGGFEAEYDGHQVKVEGTAVVLRAPYPWTLGVQHSPPKTVTVPGRWAEDGVVWVEASAQPVPARIELWLPGSRWSAVFAQQMASGPPADQFSRIPAEHYRWRGRSSLLLVEVEARLAQWDEQATIDGAALPGLVRELLSGVGADAQGGVHRDAVLRHLDVGATSKARALLAVSLAQEVN